MTDKTEKQDMTEPLLHPETIADLQVVSARIQSLQTQRKHPIVIALDGSSGTGKSTIANILAQKVGGIVVMTDDFWTGGNNEIWVQKTPAEKVAQAIDWKRLRSEVIEPLRQGQAASWHPFDFANGAGLAEQAISKGPSQIIILDGAYSSRPELDDVLDLKVLVEMNDDNRRKTRLIRREGSEFMEEWHRLWDPAEEYYFSILRQKNTFDLVIRNH